MFDVGFGERQQWNREIEFVLAAIGNAVGLGNIWRFPYLAYNSGGGEYLTHFVGLYKYSFKENELKHAKTALLLV